MFEKVVLIKGSSPALVAEALQEVISDSLSADDRAMGVDDYNSDVSVSEIVDVRRTPPFIAERRCVIVRDAGRFGGKTDSANELDALLKYLENPSDFTTIVFVSGGGTYSTKLVKAVKDVGKVVETDPGFKKTDRQKWVKVQISESGVKLTSQAQSLLTEHLGEDLDRIPQILVQVKAVYGANVTVNDEQLKPILGSAGDIVPWELTDALISQNRSHAIELVDRMVVHGEKHPVQLLTILASHYSAMFALDGAPGANRKNAATFTGTKDFPAQKAWDHAQKLGSEKVQRAMKLLVEAESDIKGGSELSRLTSVHGPVSKDGLLVLELLVARLASL